MPVIPYHPLTAQEEEAADSRGLGFSISLSPLNFIHYNRVEGLFIGTHLDFSSERIPGALLHTQLGYGSSSEEWRYSASYEHAFDLFRYKTLTFSYFDETRTNDLETVKNLENNMTALLIHEDFRDYYRSKGGEVRYSYKYKENIGSDISLEMRKYSPLENTTDWSLFRDDRSFRSNPAIEIGREVRAAIRIFFDNRDNMYVDANYWEFDAEIENEFKDFKFTGFHLKIRRIQLGLARQTFIGSFDISARSGTIAEQYLYDLGGIGTL
ncbi:DUF5686 family protein, partial [candidate division KSB1 bacterium]